MYSYICTAINEVSSFNDIDLETIEKNKQIA